MLRRFLLIFACFAFCAGRVAHADTITTFSLANGMFASGATITGSVTINTTTGAFLNQSFSVVSTSGTFLFEGLAVVQQTFLGNSQTYEIVLDSKGNMLLLDLPSGFLGSYTGSVVCSFTNQCNGGIGYVQLGMVKDGFQSGELIANANPPDLVTPEPSTLLLVASSALGLATAVRRRFFPAR